MTYERVIQDDWAQPARPPVPKTPEQLQAQADAEESGRQQRRAAIKKRIARARLSENRHIELSQAIARVDAKKEALAAAHVETCQPLQAELRELERRQVDLLIGKLPSDPQLDARRRQLLEQITKANADLKGAIAAEDRLLAALFEERRVAGEATGDLMLSSELIQLASRENAIALKVAQNRQKWADSRLAQAEDVVSHQGSRLIAATARDFLAAEVAEAQRLAAEARTDVDRITQQILDE